MSVGSMNEELLSKLKFPYYQLCLRCGHEFDGFWNEDCRMCGHNHNEPVDLWEIIETLLDERKKKS